MEFLCYGTSQQGTVTPDPTWPRSHDIRTGLCATLTLPSLCFTSTCACVDGWLYPGREICYTNFNSTQTVSSPAQVTQPSSTQDSFAKSNGPALFLSLRFFLFVFLCLSQQGWTPLSSLPPRSKDGRWWLGCQRPCRWMGDSHWVIWVGGMPRSECNTFEISGPLGTMLQVQWFCCCCCHFYIVAHDVGFSVLL